MVSSFTAVIVIILRVSACVQGVSFIEDTFSESYIGCYRQLKQKYTTHVTGALTIEGCIAACHSRNFTLAAVHYGTACVCTDVSNVMDTVNYFVTDCYSDQASPCDGNPQQICGSPNSYSLYCVQASGCHAFLTVSSEQTHGICPDEKCALRDCPETCSNDCERRYGQCTAPCKDGHYGPFCLKNCSVAHKDWCTECPDGFTGMKCNISCPKKCNNKCSKGGMCFKCPDSFYGAYCTVKCPLNCLTCDRRTGICEKCSNGYYACEDYHNITHCQKNCTDNCKSCDWLSEEYQPCRDGLNGEDCNNEYNDTCLKSNKETGQCIECKNGRYGSSCERCPRNCYATQCNNANGTCDSCASGYKCQTCRQTDGMCISGCDNGYYGQDCSEKCTTQCLGNFCRQVDGSCLACPDNRNGSHCQIALLAASSKDPWFKNLSIEQCISFATLCGVFLGFMMLLFVICKLGTFVRKADLIRIPSRIPSRVIESHRPPTVVDTDSSFDTDVDTPEVPLNTATEYYYADESSQIPLCPQRNDEPLTMRSFTPYSYVAKSEPVADLAQGDLMSSLKRKIHSRQYPTSDCRESAESHKYHYPTVALSQQNSATVPTRRKSKPPISPKPKFNPAIRRFNTAPTRNIMRRPRQHRKTILTLSYEDVEGGNRTPSNISGGRSNVSTHLYDDVDVKRTGQNFTFPDSKTDSQAYLYDDGTSSPIVLHSEQYPVYNYELVDNANIDRRRHSYDVLHSPKL